MILRVLDENGKASENDTETANIMNRTLASVFVKEDSTQNVPPTNYNYNGSILSNIEITEEIVK